MIVLSEAPEQVSPNASARKIAAITRVADLLGFRVYTIPPTFERCGSAENALAHIPCQDTMVTALWVGYIPTPERYAAIYTAALAKGIRLPNTPTQHRTAMEFDQFYPLLEGLTPRSVIIRAVSECAAAGDALGYPVFVKGVVQSRKVKRLAANLFELDNRTRGRVVVYDGRILAHGYYWDGEDPLGVLSTEEEATVAALVKRGAERLNAPYVAIDVGQVESGAWTIIEVGDGQFAGHSQIPLLELWNRLREAMTEPPDERRSIVTYPRL